MGRCCKVMVIAYQFWRLNFCLSYWNLTLPSSFDLNDNNDLFAFSKCSHHHSVSISDTDSTNKKSHSTNSNIFLSNKTDELGTDWDWWIDFDLNNQIKQTHWECGNKSIIMCKQNVQHQNQITKYRQTRSQIDFYGPRDPAPGPCLCCSQNKGQTRISHFNT